MALPTGSTAQAPSHDVAHGVVYDLRAYFGAKFDGSTDDTSHIQDAIDAAPVSGAVLVGPPGKARYTSLDFSGRRSVTFRGQGGLSAGAAQATILESTLSGAGSCINAQNTYGVRFEDVALTYVDGSLTGRVVDYRNVSGSDTAYGGLTRCYVGGTGGVRSSLAGVALDKAIVMSIRDSYINNNGVGVLGMETGYSSVVKISGGAMNDNVYAHVRNPGVSWSMQSVSFEQIYGGGMGGISHAAGMKATAMSVLGCWFGDGSVGAGSQIALFADGALIAANEIAGTATGAGVKFDENGSSGVTIVGNHIEGCDKGIDFGATSGHSRIVVSPNDFNGNNANYSGNLPPMELVAYPLVVGDGTGVNHGNGVMISDLGSYAVVWGIANNDGPRGLQIAGGSAGENLGFFGHTPVAKPTITGSRAGNAALASLLAQGATLGLWTDSTSA